MEEIFSVFDNRISKEFETACKQLFNVIKQPILEDCKTLRSVTEEVCLESDSCSDKEKICELLGNYGQSEQIELMESDFKRDFSNFIFNFYQKCCFDRKFMNKVQKLGLSGRDEIERKLSEKEDYSKLADGFHKSFLSFEDIIRLDGRSVQKLLRDVDNMDLAIALKIASEDLKNKIFKNMSKRAVESLKQDMEFAGAKLKEDVYVCQQKIINIMLDLMASDDIRWAEDWV